MSSWNPITASSCRRKLSLYIEGFDGNGNTKLSIGVPMFRLNILLELPAAIKEPRAFAEYRKRQDNVAIFLRTVPWLTINILWEEIRMRSSCYSSCTAGVRTKCLLVTELQSRARPLKNVQLVTWNLFIAGRSRQQTDQNTDQNNTYIPVKEGSNYMNAYYITLEAQPGPHVSN